VKWIFNQIKATGGRAIVPAGLLAALVLFVAWALNHLLGHGGGEDGSAPQATEPHVIESPQSQPAPLVASGEALEVTVQEDRYLVGGKDVPMEQIVSSAKAGAKVKIISGPNARLGAEKDLENALAVANQTWVVETVP
jgi:hypothetical protein